MTEKDKSTVLLEYYLKKLKLPTVLREYAALAAVCRKDRSDFPAYLLRLAERELLDREKRAAERRIKDANFPVIKTIDTYQFSAQPSINEALVRQLLTGEYLDHRENVLLIGNPGTGKTHLACALAFSACAQGKKRLQRLHKQLQRLDMLLIDELGYVPFSKAGAELLFEVISRAYEHHSLMVTTNLAFEEWTEIFGSERLTGALLDRLTHRCHILQANGQSYRLRQAKKKPRHRSPKNQDSNQQQLQS
jgi:DNA replication protein DnaC